MRVRPGRETGRGRPTATTAARTCWARFWQWRFTRRGSQRGSFPWCLGGCFRVVGTGRAAHCPRQSARTKPAPASPLVGPPPRCSAESPASPSSPHTGAPSRHAAPRRPVPSTRSAPGEPGRRGPARAAALPASQPAHPRPSCHTSPARLHVTPAVRWDSSPPPPASVRKSAPPQAWEAPRRAPGHLPFLIHLAAARAQAPCVSGKPLARRSLEGPSCFVEPDQEHISCSPCCF